MMLMKNRYKEFKGALNIWIWATVSAGLTAATYVALFREEIIGFIRLSLRRTPQKLGRTLQTSVLLLRYYITSKWLPLVIPLVSLGFVVGIWALATKTTSIGVKIGVGLVLGCFAFWLVPLTLKIMGRAK
jgi:MFS superfamily sulfate permease-like transporter